MRDSAKLAFQSDTSKRIYAILQIFFISRQSCDISPWPETPRLRAKSRSRSSFRRGCATLRLCRLRNRRRRIGKEHACGLSRNPKELSSSPVGTRRTGIIRSTHLNEKNELTSKKSAKIRRNPRIRLADEDVRRPGVSCPARAGS